MADIIILLFFCSKLWASYILIPMDQGQKNHLKAYGIAYYTLQNETKVDWLLNYRGGSFLIKYYTEIENECSIRGVSYEIIDLSLYFYRLFRQRFSRLCKLGIMQIRLSFLSNR